VATLVVIGLGVCEVMGWPFLAAPMQRWLGDALERRVSLSADPAAPPEAVIRLLGRVEFGAAHLEIGAPAWSSAPHMVLARDARVTLGYVDLWRASQGAPLRIRELRAAQLNGLVERLADGRASWQFGKNTDTPDTARLPSNLPVFGRLQVDSGGMVYRDALMALDLDGRFSLVEGADIAAASGAASGPAPGLQFKATGAFQGRPLSIDAQAAGVLPAVTDEAAVLPVTINARVGRASLAFEGTATDALHLTALTGRFILQGPSLAAVGDPLGVTLPTTGPFRAEGRLAKQGVVWNAVLDRVSIGSSRLAGAFVFDRRPHTPMLAGRLTGTQLALADLGPAFGAPVQLTAAQATADPALRPASAAPGRVLPSRDFDLPALRAMDANVLIDIDSLNLGTRLLEPLKPLRTHLVLADGVLTFRDLDARTGQGRLSGTVQLDGRKAQALWTADLRWDGVRLEHWIRQTRANEAPPYVTGSLGGQARVAGQGKSTAAILGSLRGEVRMQLKNGTISHFAVEAAGLDIAEGLGLLIKGDDTLPIQCAMVDLVADQGVLRPRVLVLDTRDSTLWVDGSLSLATEALDLRVVVAPKDFSPLALRTPLRLRGSFENPSVSLEKGTLGARLGASALLALVTPLAALIPLIDIGSSDDAKRGADACRALADRARSKPSLAPPAVAVR
jgi:uncharacterized protein involved in outer membrane biogenesis